MATGTINPSYRNSSQNSFIVSENGQPLMDVPDPPFSSVDDDYQLRVINTKQSFWQLRSKLERVLCVLLLICFLLIFCLIIAFALHTPVLKNIDQTGSAAPVAAIVEPGGSLCSEDVCTTAGCVSAAADIILAMDPTIDPCEDFYEYACGGWNRLHSIPEDETSYGTFRLVRDRVRLQMRTLLEDTAVLEPASRAIQLTRMAYHSCMNTSDIERVGSTPLKAHLERTGPWPLLHRGTWNPSSYNAAALLGRVKRDFMTDVVLTAYVYADGKDTTKNVLYFDQVELGLQAREFYLNDTLFGQFLHAYTMLIEETLQILMHDYGFNDTHDLGQVARDIVDFERSLANISTPEFMRRDPLRQYNKRTVQQLEQEFHLMDWSAFLDELLPPVVRQAFTASSTVIVNEPDYLTKLGDLLLHTPAETVVNYAFWRIIKSWTKALDSRYEDALQKFLIIMTGRDMKPPRWKSCVLATVHVFDMAAGSLYANKHFDSQDKKEALRMIGDLQESFRDIVADLAWMDTETRKIAVEKAENMLLHIGYPEMAKNMTALDEYYSKLDIVREDSYFDLGMKLGAWALNKDLLELLRPFDRQKFDVSAAVVNAFYSPEKNAISFPAAILQPPFFRGDYPKAVNYGAMGAVIGHEVTHGFDDQGRLYDSIGNLQNWWSESAFHGFEQRKDCMVKQYSDYVVPEIHMNVNGNLTLGENIADNGGVKEAFQAYQRYVGKLAKEEPRLPGLQHLSNDQIFFLSFANFWCGMKKPQTLIQQVLTDPHSPDMFRVIGVMSNSADFARAYKCDPGSKMNPGKSNRTKCEVW